MSRLDLQGHSTVTRATINALVKIVLFLAWSVSLLVIIWLEFIKHDCVPDSFDLACGGAEFGWYNIVPSILFVLITVLFIVKRGSK